MAEPSKDDRRRLNKMVDEWSIEGFLEKISVPYVRGLTPCIRLIVRSEEATAVELPRPDVPEWEREEESLPFGFVPAYDSLDHHLFHLIEDAGEEGTTYRVRLKVARLRILGR